MIVQSGIVRRAAACISAHPMRRMHTSASIACSRVYRNSKQKGPAPQDLVCAPRDMMTETQSTTSFS